MTLTWLFASNNHQLRLCHIVRSCIELSRFNFVFGRHVISYRIKEKKRGGGESYLLVRLCKNILLRGKNRSIGDLDLHTLTRAKIYRTTAGILPVLHVCNSEVLFPVADHSPSHFSRERTKATPRRTAPRFQDYLAGSVRREAWYSLGIRLRAGQNFQFGSSNFSPNRLSPVIQPFYDLTKPQERWPLTSMLSDRYHAKRNGRQTMCIVCNNNVQISEDSMYVYIYGYNDSQEYNA